MTTEKKVFIVAAFIGAVCLLKYAFGKKAAAVTQPALAGGGAGGGGGFPVDSGNNSGGVVNTQPTGPGSGASNGMPANNTGSNGNHIEPVYDSPPYIDPDNPTGPTKQDPIVSSDDKGSCDNFWAGGTACH